MKPVRCIIATGQIAKKEILDPVNEDSSYAQEYVGWDQWKCWS
jgi:hypothetical protein